MCNFPKVGIELSGDVLVGPVIMRELRHAAENGDERAIAWLRRVVPQEPIPGAGIEPTGVSIEPSGVWQPIASAPRYDEVLLFVPATPYPYQIVAHTVLEEWRDSYCGAKVSPAPTHWQPLPPPP